jgi:hypothetical protein
VNPVDIVDAYERFRAVIRKPLVTIKENDCLWFNDGTDDGFRYPVAKIDPHNPLWDLFSQPWFSEQHARAAAPLVRWWLDYCSKAEAREADRDRGLP